MDNAKPILLYLPSYAGVCDASMASWLSDRIGAWFGEMPDSPYLVIEVASTVKVYSAGYKDDPISGYAGARMALSLGRFIVMLNPDEDAEHLNLYAADAVAFRKMFAGLFDMPEQDGHVRAIGFYDEDEQRVLHIGMMPIEEQHG